MTASLIVGSVPMVPPVVVRSVLIGPIACASGKGSVLVASLPVLRTGAVIVVVVVMAMMMMTTWL